MHHLLRRLAEPRSPMAANLLHYMQCLKYNTMVVARRGPQDSLTTAGAVVPPASAVARERRLSPKSKVRNELQSPDQLPKTPIATAQV